MILPPGTMSPPVSLTKRWRKIKKRCSFSSSDQLVRSKSFTEQHHGLGNQEVEAEEEREFTNKYLTVGARDHGRFQGLRTKLVQWNCELKKRRSSENLSVKGDRERPRDTSMFVVASPSSNSCVKSALVISSTTPHYSTQSLKPRPKPSLTSSPWSSPPPSPPSSSEDSSSDRDSHQRSTYSNELSKRNLTQDQDSGYDGFCPEKSIYSTGSSDTSSVLSTDGGDASYTEVYGRSRARPRPAPIYEKHCDYWREPAPQHHSTPLAKCQGQLRAQVSQATVVSLAKTLDRPPPLPPRPPPSQERRELPPVPQDKPRTARIQQGAVSLNRKRQDFRELGRRRGSYHDSSNKENDAELVIPTEEKVPMESY